jgi:hypothetical protein
MLMVSGEHGLYFLLKTVHDHDGGFMPHADDTSWRSTMKCTAQALSSVTLITT